MNDATPKYLVYHFDQIKKIVDLYAFLQLFYSMVPDTIFSLRWYVNLMLPQLCYFSTFTCISKGVIHKSDPHDSHQ